MTTLFYDYLFLLEDAIEFLEKAVVLLYAKISFPWPQHYVVNGKLSLTVDIT